VPTRPLRLEDAQLQAFLEVSPDALVLADTDGQILRVNRQLEQLFRYGHGELLGQMIEVLLPERYRDRHRRNRTDFHGHPRMRAMGEGLELHGLSKDGEEFPVDISLGPVTTSRGEVVLAAVRDVTERRRLQEAARQLEAATTRRRQALELNDGVVQGLTAAGLALELGEHEHAREVLDRTLDAARELVSDLLSELGGAPGLSPGDLIRSTAADLGQQEGEQ
jgi:PAS domain S-box-containing protein